MGLETFEIVPKPKLSLFARLKLVLALGTFLAGSALVIYGLSLDSCESGNELNLGISKPAGIDNLTQKGTEIGKEIQVDVGGAVNLPNVYTLPAGSRLLEIIKLAGGLDLDADKAWISRHLNLAEELKDGQKIYLPFLSDQSEVESAIGFSSLPPKADKPLININTATKAELETLTGIGPQRAEAIIKGRPYQKLADLLEKKILGESIFAQIKDQITVGN